MDDYTKDGGMKLFTKMQFKALHLGNKFLATLFSVVVNWNRIHKQTKNKQTKSHVGWRH